MRGRGHSLVTLLVVMASLAVVGCQTQTTARCVSDACEYWQTFHYNLTVGATSHRLTLDPNRAGDTASRTVTSLLFDGLVTLDQQMRVEDWGARQVDISTQGLIYTFHLRLNQAFADGRPVTADDYAYSLNRTLNPCVASPNAHLLFAIEDAAIFASETCVNGHIALNSAAGQAGSVITTLLGTSIRTPDPEDVVVGLTRPDGGFLATLASANAGALDPAIVGPDLASEQWTATLAQRTTGRGSSGMFALYRIVPTADSSPDNSELVTILANPYWWGIRQAKKPYLQQIDFQLIPSASDSYAAYQAGEFDNGFPTPELLKAAISQPDIHSINMPINTVLSFNAARPPFDSLVARQAICLAVNRESLLDDTSRPVEVPHWNLVPLGMPGYQALLTGPDGVTSVNGDTAKAAAHWSAYRASPGYAPEPAITYLYDTSDPNASHQAQALSTGWERVLGVRVALKGEVHASWQADVMTGRYDIAPVTTTADYPDAEDVLSRAYLPAGNAQVPDVPRADALLVQADASADQTTRTALYQQAEQLLVNNVVSCPLFQSILLYQSRPFVHNWLLAPNGLTPLDAWAQTYLSPH